MFNIQKISAEVDKYTASAWLRRQGMSDNELHTLMTEAKKPGVFRLFGKLPTVINPAKWIAGMDSAVALSLWKYAKEDVAAKTGLEGEELLKATAEFYDSLIESTQSMSDVLHRPEIQKRNDVISELFGTFKTDLFQGAGMLREALGRFSANKNKENGAALAKTAYSLTMSTVWSLVVGSLIAMLRYKVDPFRDDDDELTFESWIERIGYQFSGEISGYIFPLLGGEVFDIIENIHYGSATNDFADTIVISSVADLISAFTTVAMSLKDGEMPSRNQLEKLLTLTFQMFGVPAKNILRTLEALRLHAKDFANGNPFSFEAGLE
jgi:hypothetical protein